MEDSVVSRYKAGPLKTMFDDRYVVTSYPGSGNNWAEGFCYHGPRHEDKLLKVIRHVTERCDSLQGFLLFLSTGGGTGSGLGTYTLRLLSDHYPHVDRYRTHVAQKAVRMTSLLGPTRLVLIIHKKYMSISIVKTY